MAASEGFLAGTDIGNFLDAAGVWLLSSGLRIVLILVIMFVALRAARFVSERIFTIFSAREDTEIKKRAATLTAIIRVVLNMAVVVIGGVIILSELGVEIGPILAAAGVLGLAVGFGAQHLVQDIISGFFLLLEDQIRVGDVVEVAGKSGVVEGVTLRTVVLRDLHGNVHHVRNGQINIVTNMTKGYSRYVLDLRVAYNEDVDRVMAILRELDAELRTDPELGPDILEPVEILGVDKFTESAVIIRARLTTKPVRQWVVGREFNRRLKKRFDAEGMEIPFPSRTIYMGQPKQGGSESLNVEMRADRTTPKP